MQKNGFTIIELIVSITIVAFLSSIVLFSISKYINSGKDATIRANLAVLIPAAETFYGTSSQEGLGYSGFCETSVVSNIISQLPVSPLSSLCPDALCCHVLDGGSAWAACIREYTDQDKAFCVDSRGVRKDISISDCISFTWQCP